MTIQVVKDLLLFQLNFNDEKIHEIKKKYH